MRPSLLVRYYKHQQQRGTNPLYATLKLPPNLFRYYRRMRQEGHQIYGYGRFDRPLLASYSRSGTNWLRYIIETISGQPTPGQVRVHYGVNFIIDRAHKAYPVMDRYPQVILLLRDYRECLIRHHQALWHKAHDAASFLRDESVFQRPNWYIRNVAAFDKFAGPKLLIYYEDLLSNPGPVIRELGEFLEFDPEIRENFIANIDRYFQESVGAYTKRGHKSVTTTGKRDFRHHAREHATLAQQKEFDSFYHQNYPQLYEKYLVRYALPATDD